ncbi:D-alanyl-D-alanine carboxypeptidase DacF precursor [compost metagenome]
MFDYAFSQYSVQPIYKTGEVIGKVKVKKGKTSNIELAASKTMSVLIKKGSEPGSITQKLELPDKLVAPVQEGQVIGKLVVYQDGKPITEFELKAATSIDKAGWWALFKRTTSQLFFVDS